MDGKNNQEYAKKFRDILKLRYEPVAVRLIREDEDFPEGFETSDDQMSYCQAVETAKNGKMYAFTPGMSACNVGASALGMVPTPDKVRSGEFHFNIGAHDTQEATEKMIAARTEIPFKVKGALITPLKDMPVEPDVVIFTDIPERIYWFVPLSTAEEGGRASFTTAPFQAACVDSTSIPMVSGRPNISIGCFGCRKRTDIKADEMMIGIPWKLVPGMIERLDIYKDGIMTKAKRD